MFLIIFKHKTTGQQISKWQPYYKNKMYSMALIEIANNIMQNIPVVHWYIAATIHPKNATK